MRHLNNNLPLVVIFGRTNVGKSTLFNCLIEKKQALVSPIEGTTRDSNIGQLNWRGVSFNLVDTGGITDLKFLLGKSLKTNDIESKVQKQARSYIKQADLILFLVDNKTGLLPQDKEIASILKKIIDLKKIILIANKVDSLNQNYKAAEFYKLSLGEPAPISAATGTGTGDLLDIIIKKLSKKSTFDNNISTLGDHISVCILGKPNVGKSNLLNSILGYERVIVSPIPHTTREPQDTEILYNNQPINLIDTAGISKRGKKTKGLEKYGIVKSLIALNKSNIALLVLDISEPITHQDLKLVEEIIDRKKSLIIIANKWDKIIIRDTKKFTNYIYAKLPFIQFAPIQFTSALTKEKVNKILSLILEINEQRKKEISSSILEKFISRLIRIHKPAKGRGVKHPHIYGFKQVLANPPEFELKIGLKEDLHFSYLRFIENRLREKFGFKGTPISIKVLKGSNYLN